ncbi:uncharacterized protein TNCV_458461 [Trichonephila clavipes]|nr:uncharacterized protein TNCV_458461 [Trichonephila clavipes]
MKFSFLAPRRNLKLLSLLWSMRVQLLGRGVRFTCRNCGGGDRGRVAIYRPFGEVSLSLNRTVTCMVLKANDRRTSCPCHDEFRGPRSDYVRQEEEQADVPYYGICPPLTAMVASHRLRILRTSWCNISCDRSTHSSINICLSCWVISG